MKNKFNKKNLLILAIVIAIIAILLAISLYNKQKTYETATQNNYNMAFYEVVNHMQDVQNYLAKSVISKSSTNGAETLTNVWREANLTRSIFINATTRKSRVRKYPKIFKSSRRL